MLPKGPEGRISLYNGIGEAMYAQSKNKEAAWEVIEYCYGTSVQSVFAQQGVTFPSIQELIPSFVQTWQDERGIDVSAFIDQVDEGIALSAESQYWNQIGDLETTYMHLLLSGELTPKAFGQTMDEEIANIVK